MISTVSQAKYLAHRLTKASKFGEIEKLIPVYLYCVQKGKYG